MKILVVGGGGREHAIAWRLAQDAEEHEIYCAPGNAGTLDVATNVALKVDDIDGIVEWSKAEKPDLVVVGPEAPLVAGLVDRLEKAGVPAFGPVEICLTCFSPCSHLSVSPGKRSVVLQADASTV